MTRVDADATGVASPATPRREVAEIAAPQRGPDLAPLPHALMPMTALRQLGGEGDEPAPSSVTDPLIGRLVADRYRVVRKIGEGGQASVYIAKHTLIKRLVALKALSPAMATDQDLVRRFLDEGEVAGTMGHPNVVESLDMGVMDDGRPFLVLEYLQGTTVAAEIAKSGALEVARACYIGTQIASALGAAHARGIVHRDLKPENVFLVDRETHADHVKVLDFGISKIEKRRGSERDSLIVGTPEYMAPEQITGAASVDSRADVFALGAMLYEMLSGKPPLAVSPGENVLEVVVRRIPAPLDRICPRLPAALVQIVERAMQKDRTKRTQTIDEVRESLEPFALPSPPVVPDKVGPRVSGFTPVSTPPRTQRIVTPAPIAYLPSREGPITKTTAMSSAPPPPPSRSLEVPILAGIVGALAAGIIVFWALRGSAPVAPPVLSAAVATVQTPTAATVTSPVITPAPMPPTTGALPSPTEPAVLVPQRPRVVYLTAAPPTAHPAATAAVAEKPIEKPDCTTPFYFTETGKKVFKAGCL